MFQQIIALIVIAFFLGRLFWQKRKNHINRAEFYFWLLFWSLAAVAIIFIKWIDEFIAGLGFSSQGIDVLFYIAVILLFYLIFRIRLRLESMEKDITRITREISIERGKKTEGEK
jgi:hypothetical protein